MKSSSSALWEIDVFVSFRGTDVRRTFASHLFCELNRMGINAFRDDRDLKRGRSISPKLIEAIESSRFAIVVVSENYSASSWCLDELLKIIECKDTIGQTVIPIFYGVDPSEMRKQTGSFAENMKRHSNKERCSKWEESLMQLAAISGEDSRNWKDESKLIKKIVKDISDQLISTSLDNSEELIGMSTHMGLLQSLMSMDHGQVRTVGIWGMGGVGKSTVARYLYNHLSCRFQAHCFIDNVKDVWSRYGKEGLQEEFLSKIFRENGKRQWSSALYSNIVKERFRYKKVLIVLDDVDEQEQLNAFVKRIDSFGSGSRIIVTTRDKNLLVSYGVDIVYKVKCLPRYEAIQLFSCYAFKTKIIPSEFRELSVRVIDYASGLPLALRVLGSFLYHRSEKEWESTLAKLESFPNKDVMEVLRVSCDRLDEQEKAIFLYIACFFNTKHVDYVRKLLDICGYASEIGIAVLAEKSLIDISNGFIKLHDLIEQMGRELVRAQSDNPGERLLVWDPKDIYELLSANSGTNQVEGMSLNLSEITDLFASDRAFEGFSNLKFLNFYYHSYGNNNNTNLHLHLPVGLSYLPRKLHYLRWDRCPLKAMPSEFYPESLVELCMRNSHLEKLWDGTQPLGSLKKMDLSHSRYLVEIPDLSKATNLEELILSYCQSLVKITPTIKNLHRLYLNSTKIEYFPSSIGCLSYLTKLDVSDCQSLRSVPSSVGGLVSLKSMKLNECKHLQNLPETIQNLRSLETLEVSGSLYIDEFPHVAVNVTVLRIAMTSIQEVPVWICNASRLRSLDISENKRLRLLPVSISELRSLRGLKLSGCSVLESFPPEICDRLICLRWFDLDRTNIKELPENIGNLIALEVLRAGKSAVSQVPSSIDQLRCLRVLSVGSCFYKPKGMFSRFPCLPRFYELRDLYLSNLNMVEIPKSIGRLRSLESLDLSGNNFEAIPASIIQLNELCRLNLNNCQRLLALPEFSRSLLYVYAHGCSSLESISQCFRHSLHKLVVSNCYKLDPNVQLLIHCNMQLVVVISVSSFGAKLNKTVLLAFVQQTPNFTLFPGRDVPSCFNYKATGPSLKIYLPQSQSTSEIIGFSACVMIRADVQYPMNDLTIRCLSRGVHGGELVSLNDDWFSNPNSFSDMHMNSDHLLLFSRILKPVDTYSELRFEFSLVSQKEDLKPLRLIKRCAVQLIIGKRSQKKKEVKCLPYIFRAGKSCLPLKVYTRF